MSDRIEIFESWWDAYWPYIPLHQNRDLWNLEIMLQAHAQDFLNNKEGKPHNWLLIGVHNKSPGPINEVSLRSNSLVASTIVDETLKPSLLRRLRPIGTRVLPARHLIQRDSGEHGDQYYAVIPHPVELYLPCPHCFLIDTHAGGWFDDPAQADGQQVGRYLAPSTPYERSFNFSRPLCPFHWRWILTGRCLSDTQCVRLNEIANHPSLSGRFWSQAHDDQVRNWVQRHFPLPLGPQEQANLIREIVRRFGVLELARKIRVEANNPQQQRPSLLAELVRDSVPDLPEPGRPAYTGVIGDGRPLRSAHAAIPSKNIAPGPQAPPANGTAHQTAAYHPSNGTANGNAFSTIEAPGGSPAEQDSFNGRSRLAWTRLPEGSATSTTQPGSHEPPRNAPTGPAMECWNCGGQGHRSSKYPCLPSRSEPFVGAAERLIPHCSAIRQMLQSCHLPQLRRDGTCCPQLHFSSE